MTWVPPTLFVKMEVIKILNQIYWSGSRSQLTTYQTVDNLNCTIYNIIFVYNIKPMNCCNLVEPVAAHNGFTPLRHCL